MALQTPDFSLEPAKKPMEEIGDAPERPELPDPPEERSGWELQKLRAHNEEIIRLYVASGERMTHQEIADKVGVTQQTVSNTLNSRIGQLKVRRLQNSADDAAIDTMKKLHELAGYSVQELEELLLDPNTSDRLRTRIAQDILDRTGNKKPERVEHAHGHFTKEDVEEMKDRARATGKVKEVEAEVVEE